MKKKFIAILLLFTILGSYPVSANAKVSDFFKTETVTDVRETLESDKLHLSNFFTYIPDFKVFVEKLKAVMIYADLKKYAEAVEASDNLIQELTEMENSYKEEYADLESLLSDAMKDTLAVFKYYCDVSFVNCIRALSELNDYINGKQNYKSQTLLKTNLKNFETCYNNVYVIDEFLDHAFRASSEAFYASYITDKNSINDVYTTYFDKFTSGNWYDKYLEHVKEHKSDYSLSNIVKAKLQTATNNSSNTTVVDNGTTTTTTSTQPEKPKNPAKTDPEIVYWVESGEVYHKSSGCASLGRSKNIKSGTIRQSGKDRLCKVCG